MDAESVTLRCGMPMVNSGVCTARFVISGQVDHVSNHQRSGGYDARKKEANGNKIYDPHPEGHMG
jgi:hypothetical protein